MCAAISIDYYAPLSELRLSPSPELYAPSPAMLRFFEPEVDPWWPAASPPLPPRHYSVVVDHKPHGEEQYSQNGPAPAMPAGTAGRRVPSALETVDLVKGRWFPAPPASNGSRSPSPNSSSSIESMNSYGGSGINTPRQSIGASISLESPSAQTFAMFHGERNSSMSVEAATKSQHEAMVDWTNKRRVMDESQRNGMEVAARDSKKHRPAGSHEEKLQGYQPSFESTSSPWSMATTHQSLKGVPVSKSKKMGDKITALQQLVSPFGKTDTASVLHEAAIYIKALQEQIKLLINPYLESISSIESIQVRHGGDHRRRHQHHQQQVHKKSTGLREVGLCMVPISPIVAGLVNQEQLDGCVSESLPW